MRTRSILVDGITDARKIAISLVEDSMWFQLDPYPDDQYNFSVKEEAISRLDNAIRATYEQPRACVLPLGADADDCTAHDHEDDLVETVRADSISEGELSPADKVAMVGPFTVTLSCAGNPDMRQAHNLGVPILQVVVNSLDDARDECRKYIGENDLGGGNWTGGQITDEQGNPIAEVSYNGRIWKPGHMRDSAARIFQRA